MNYCQVNFQVQPLGVHRVKYVAKMNSRVLALHNQKTWQPKNIHTYGNKLFFSKVFVICFHIITYCLSC